MLSVKNYNKFQHFKDSRPPWIKLYRDLLDDLEWHDLDPKAAKALVMIWLIASENEGRLPEPKKLAFRLRLSDIEMSHLLNSLSHWLIQDDNGLISTCHQLDTPETETETEESREELGAVAPPPVKVVKRTPVLPDEQYLIELQQNPAYSLLNVQQCYYRAVEWCRVNGRQPTRRFF